MKKRRTTALLVTVGGVVVVFGLGGCSGNDGTSRQDEVAMRGAAVMPFDLNKTHHAFEQNATGGVETVRALDPADSAQIGLIRSHLRSVATKFASGDFSDPMAIHGDQMAGVGALSAGASRVKIEYAELHDGAKITYASDEPVLIGAIHDWFNAQVSDHGQHAGSH